MPPMGPATEPQPATYPSPTLTVPVRRRAAIASPSASVAANTEELSPYSVLLASAIASSTESTG